jgi:TolB-like protein/Tfp pilus assembly protein PilF
VLGSLALQQVNTSIEVFTIENQTSQADYDYLCKGTTAEVTRRLLQLQGVRVIPLHSPRTGAPATKVGRFALDGMLQASGGQLRLSIELSDNDQNGALLWSDVFERKQMDDPLAMQSEIARKTVAALEQRILLHSDPQAAGFLSSSVLRLKGWFALQTSGSLPDAPTRNNAALDLYMRGHNLLEEVSAPSADAAIQYFKRAIDEDPRFALAYAATADGYMALMNYNYRPNQELAAQARMFANKAVEIDPNLAEAQMVLGAVRQMDWDWKGASSSYELAIRLKPALARLRRWYAGLLLQLGHVDAALVEARRSFEMDPYDRSAPQGIGLYFFLGGRLQEAIDVLLKGIAQKDMAGLRSNLGQVYAWLGHKTPGLGSDRFYRLALEQAETIAAAERTSADGRTSYADPLFAVTYALMGDLSSTQIYAKRMENDMEAGRTSPVDVAWVYAIRRETEKACALLERAVLVRDRHLFYAKVFPFLENLHGLPRFRAIIQNMGLA